MTPIYLECRKFEQRLEHNNLNSGYIINLYYMKWSALMNVPLLCLVSPNVKIIHCYWQRANSCKKNIHCKQD